MIRWVERSAAVQAPSLDGGGCAARMVQSPGRNGASAARRGGSAAGGSGVQSRTGKAGAAAPSPVACSGAQQGQLRSSQGSGGRLRSESGHASSVGQAQHAAASPAMVRHAPSTTHKACEPRPAIPLARKSSTMTQVEAVRCAMQPKYIGRAKRRLDRGGRASGWGPRGRESTRRGRVPRRFAGTGGGGQPHPSANAATKSR